MLVYKNNEPGDNMADENNSNPSDSNPNQNSSNNDNGDSPVRVGADLCPEFLSSEGDKTSVSDDPEVLSRMIQEKTIETIHWYIERKKWPRRFSRTLRLLAIFLVIIGGLAPLTTPYIDLFLHQIYGPTYEVGQLASTWGYMALALAGSFVLMDSLFGFSTTWMRYVTTQLKLQQALYDFQMDWAIIKEQCKHSSGHSPEEPSQDNAPGAAEGEQPLPDDSDTMDINCNCQSIEMLKRLKTFRMNMMSIVTNETQSWISEYKSSLALLEKQAHEEQSKLGQSAISQPK